MSLGLIVLLVSCVALLFIYVPLAFALGLSTLAYMLIQGAPLTIIPQQLYSGAENFVLMALPLFILAGNLMNTGGITKRIINMSLALVGHIRGGLALVNVIASMFFAGVSGSAVADTASLGAILIPAMKREGYGSSFSAAVTACSSTIGIVIPPSVPMVLHGFVSGISIGTMFIAGIIPGVLIGLIQMIIAYYISVKREYPRSGDFSWAKVWAAFKDSWMALILPLIILGFITFGIATPTEVAGIAVVYALVVGMFCYKELKLSDLKKIFLDSVKTTASVMIIISFSMLLGWALSQQRVPQAITTAIMGITENPYLGLLIISALLIVAGCFLHGTALQLIIVPMLLPLIAKMGIDPLQFGMVVVMCVGIGQQTPPVGSALFVTSAISGDDMLEITKENLPFMMSLVLTLLLIIFVPAIVTTIPSFFVG